jgi:hypothetical protein
MQHPSETNHFSESGIYGARETGEAFSGTEDRHVKPLENGAVFASDSVGLVPENKP